ncbi:hypothetical protein QP306_25460, partial [Escherichia coli]|nr:hypothetical protein [Escherichia coli]
AAKWSDTLEIEHTGDTLPSMPHIRMTMDDISRAGGQVLYHEAVWTVPSHEVQLAHTVVVEPDLSNAAPFLCAALIAGGTVRVPR